MVGSKKMTDGSTPEEKTTHCITAVGQNINMLNIPWGDACRGLGFLRRKRRDLLLKAKENAIHCQGCLSMHETNQSSLPKAPPWFQTGRQGGEGRVAAGRGGQGGHGHLTLFDSDPGLFLSTTLQLCTCTLGKLIITGNCVKMRVSLATCWDPSTQ